MSIFKIIGAVLVGIAAIDLLFGNTNQPVLPSFLGNVLTQQWDVVLGVAGVLMLIFL